MNPSRVDEDRENRQPREKRNVKRKMHRDDLPPLGILTLQANPNLEFLGSIDSEGKWKSQVQLFFRY